MLCAHSLSAYGAGGPRITLAPKLTLARLVDIAAAQYPIDIEYTPGDLTRSVTIRSAQPYTPGELWDLAHQMLEANGLTSVVAPGDRALYRIVKIQTAADHTEPRDSLPSPQPGFAILEYPIEHIAAPDLVQALESFEPPLDLLQIAPNGGAVNVGALTRRHPMIGEHIANLDELASHTTTEIVQLRHANAQAAVLSINTYLQNLGTRRPDGSIQPGPKPDTLLLTSTTDRRDRWLDLIAIIDSPGTITTRAYTIPDIHDQGVIDLINQLGKDPSSPDTAGAWRVVPNPITRTLVITASEREHTRIADLVEQINTIPAEQRRVTRSFVVKNRNANDLRQSLENLLGVRMGDRFASTTSELGTNESQAAQIRALDDQRDIVMTVDPELNTIIAIGAPSVVERVADLIARMDVRQPQVQLELMLVSLSEGESKDLGVELRAQLGDTGTLIGLGSIFGLSSVTPGSSAAAATGTGGTAVVLDPGDYSVVVKALERVSQGRSVSKASALVNNNESASVSNTVQQPFSTTTLDDGDSITSFGGSESAGTQISVTPQIAEGEFLVLTYDVSLSAFIGEATSEGLPPPSQNTSISSVATIPDGYAIVVGGLELLTNSDADTKTPLLGDIPILGNLFKSQTESLSTTKFYLFIRASVLRSPAFERLKYISDRAIEESDADLGWPTVKPRIIR
jgi:general secretion pathway protein D